MKYRRLGSAGLKISEVGLGANNFGWVIDEKASVEVIQHALDIGINYIDTADLYGKGLSEEFVGKAVKDRRQEVIIATKFTSPTGEGPNNRGGSRYHIMEAVDASLRRLQTDYIDLYQMHLPDLETPIEETLRTLDDLVRAGKVRYIGCSNFAAWQLSDALCASKVHNLQSFVTVQCRYNLIDRRIEAELVPCCQAHNVGVIPWGPLAGGFLTGKYEQGKVSQAGGRLSGSNRAARPYQDVWTEANWNKLAKLQAFASARNHSVGELAIAWLLAKSWVSTIISGARTKEQASANLKAAEWQLTEPEITEVDAIS